MNPIATQQAALDNALVPSEKRLKIERCNARIAFTKPQKEETYQVTLEALKLSPCYLAFQITADVLEIYMHQFWNTIKKIRKTDAYDFKLDKKKCRVDTEVFREIFQICPRLPNQDFVELHSEDDLLSFIMELGYSGNCEMLSTIRTDQMHQPWRTFANQQDLIGSGNYELKSCGPCTIRRTLTMINLHTARDDILLGALKFVFKIEDCQKYGALIPNGMINQDIIDSKDYKTYFNFSTGKVPPKKARKYKKPASPKLKTFPASTKEPTQKGKDTQDVSTSKKKASAKADREKGIELLSDAALFEDAQMKKALKKSRRESHKLQASGSSEGVDFESEVLDKPTGKPKDTSKGTGVKPGVPDVSKEDSTDSEAESQGDSEEDSDDVNEENNNDDDDEDDNSGNDDDGNNDDDNNDGNDDDGDNDVQDSKQTDSDDDENPPFTLKDYEEEETQEDEYVYTPKKDKSDDDEKMNDEEDDEVTKELYEDLNINQGIKDVEMTNAEQGGADQQNAAHEPGFVHEEEDAHVTLTTVHDKTEGPMQSSSLSSDFISKLLNLDNPSPYGNEIALMMDTSTVPPPPPPVNPSPHHTMFTQQPTPDSITTTTNPTMTSPEILNFASLFHFDQRVSALETKMSEFNQTSLSADVVSLIPSIVDQYIASKMKEAVDVAVRLQ
ncbi:hypothetical protein Tco_0097997 [Tanacetum coccineum]